MVTAKAGSAVLIHHRVFHGNFQNSGDRSRELLAIAYRPAWAGPVSKVTERDEDDLKNLEPRIRDLLGDPNQRRDDYHGGNKPPNMPDQATGMSPSRWSSSPT